MRASLVIASLATVAGASAARADDRPGPDRPWLRTGIGVAAMVGGGATMFVSDQLRAATNPGAQWSGRLTIGTRRAWGLEAIYSGSSQHIDTLDIDSSAMLVSHGVAALFRLNLAAEGMWQPYATIGAGFRHYHVAYADFNRSSVADSDVVGELPLAGGCAMRERGLILDARLGFRFAIDSDLVESSGAGYLHAIGFDLNVGWEF